MDNLPRKTLANLSRLSLIRIFQIIGLGALAVPTAAFAHEGEVKGPWIDRVLILHTRLRFDDALNRRVPPPCLSDPNLEICGNLDCGRMVRMTT